MTNRETNTANAAEATVDATYGSTDLTCTVDSTTTLPSSPCYLVIDPDDDAKREIIYFDGTFTGTTLVTSDLANRYLAGSAAGSGITHDIGAKVIHAAGLSQLWTDINDRVDNADADIATNTADIATNTSDLAALDTVVTSTGSGHDHDGTDSKKVATGSLTGHDKATHDALGLDHGSLSGLGDFTADHGAGHDGHDHTTALGTASLDDLGNLTAPTKNASLNKVTLAGGASAADPVVDMGNGYVINQDNTGSGVSGDRLWVDTPNDGEVVIGPRAGDALDKLRLRSEILAVDDDDDSGTLPILTGINGDVTGTAPTLGTDNFYMKAGYVSGNTDAQGDLAATLTGSFPNGVVCVVATAKADGTPTRHVTVNSVTTSTVTFRFYKTGDGTVLASDSAATHFIAIGF